MQPAGFQHGQQHEQRSYAQQRLGRGFHCAIVTRFRTCHQCPRHRWHFAASGIPPIITAITISI
jgi:hypothetical protein